MVETSLLIKLNADAKNATKAFDDIKKQSKDLTATLSTVGTVSAVAFAASSAAIGYAVAQFNEAREQADALTLALQNQGIYTKELSEEYDKLADDISKKNGVDDDAIKGALATGQAFLGQQQITEGLTQAVVDLAAKQKIDLNSAFELVGKGVQGNTVGLKKLGIQLADNLTQEERTVAIQEQIAQKFGGSAAAADKAAGGIGALQVAFGNIIEGIGERFAPIFGTVVKLLTDTFNAIAENDALLDLAAALLAATAAVSGILAALAGLGIAFITLSAAATALGVSLSAAFFGIPLIIGAVVGALVFLARNWDSVTQFVRSLVTGLVSFVREAFGGLGEIIGGIFSLDTGRIQAGLTRVKNSLKAGADAYRETYQQIEAETAASEEKQNEIKKQAADKAAKERAAHEQREKDARAADRAARIAELEGESPKIVEILKKEAEIKKALVDETDRQVITAQRARLEQLAVQEEDARTQERERKTAFAEEQRAFEAELQAGDEEARAQLTQQQLDELNEKLLTETEVERNIESQKLQTRIEARNREIEERKKYGQTIAAIDKVLQSEQVKGAKDAADDLVALQSSKSNELKAIGKAAAVAQIAIATAESAMNIYRGFSTIPIIGPALGVAGAAAAVAFGAERTSNVLAAAQGGLVEGGIPGRDSVPALLEPGELVVPRRNFNDVVGSVQTQGGGRDDEILSQLQEMNGKLTQPTQIVVQGDVLADDAYMETFVNKLSNFLEFRNGKLFGVTA